MMQKSGVDTVTQTQVKETAKHLVVISYDAFSEDNWGRAGKLPNLSKLLQKAAFTSKLKSVYPSLTYVAHTTMVTGVYPDKHGIYHNNPLQPFVREEEQQWFWYKKDLRVPAIYDAVKAHKMETAAILWPVTAKASIKYNIPEIRAIKNENQALKVFRNGSPLFSLEMEMKYRSLRRGIEQPYLDDFTTMCAVDTIMRKKPNLLLVHLIDLDDAKHENGTDSWKVDQALVRMDKRLGDLMQAVEEAGIQKDTVFLIVGDHGQINIRYKVRLNRLLRENGLIYEENGKTKWRAYVQSAGGAAYVHIKQGDDEAQIIASAVLEKAMREDRYGIESLYARDELDRLHVGRSFQYMVEAKNGWCFDDSLAEPVITDLEEQGIKYATHGYSPHKAGYRCNLVISGDIIKSEYPLGDVEMADLAPTMARILGIEFNYGDGRALNEIFR